MAAQSQSPGGRKARGPCRHGAGAQHTRSRGEAVAAALVADLAGNALELDRQLAALDKFISGRFRTHRYASVIMSASESARRRVLGHHRQRHDHRHISEPSGRRRSPSAQTFEPWSPDTQLVANRVAVPGVGGESSTRWVMPRISGRGRLGTV
jgi:hypothetical protein